MSQSAKPNSFSSDETIALAVVLDSIVPASADGTMPSAGSLGIADDVEAALDATPELKAVIADGLAALVRAAREREPEGLQALSAAQTAEILNDFVFPPAVVLQTYAAYYRHPRVLAILGVDARPPHPEGYAMPPNDLDLLEPVRRRPAMYRSA